MKLVASLVCRNELDRYLVSCMEHLLAFVDEVRVLDDGSDDGSYEALVEMGAVVDRSETSTFFQHEGRTRQRLLEWTMQANPTHVLSIDFDEFVADGMMLRDALAEESRSGVWKLAMSEVWQADEDQLLLRFDGAWSPRPVGILYAIPADMATNRVYRRHWRMPDKALACGRTPVYITQMGNRTTTEPVTTILHFGWACAADRAARHARYVEHDGGQHHASKHLDSIMWNDARVDLHAYRWPPSLDREQLLARANRR